MRKCLSALGMFVLVCFSFFFTEKTVTVVKDQDSIMVRIKEASSEYVMIREDAVIEGDTIIPGIASKVIDEESSYLRMKRYGSYNPSLLVYKDVMPEISLYKHYNKYVISGNPMKNMVSLIFIVEENDDITKVLKILDEKKVKGTFFLDGYWFEKNNDMVNTLIHAGHTVGNYSYGKDYTNSSFVWMDTIIKKVGNQKNSYCYNVEDDREALEICSRNKDYTIRPSIIIKEQPMIEMKKGLDSGSLISMEVEDKVIMELYLMIDFIHGKGYTLVSLEEHLKEN